MTTPEKEAEEARVSAAIRTMCARDFGLLDSRFLCQSLGSMNPPAPICVPESASLREVVRLLELRRIGCVLVVNTSGKLSGIFSERDCVVRVLAAATPVDLDDTPVSALMTPDPVREGPTTTTAYALNLMSHGGFRHLPLVDDENRPIGIISVKNIIDFLVNELTNDLLEFEAAGTP